MESEIIRHGDVNLIRCDIPAEAKQVYRGKEFVAQEGETTGHMHRIRGAEFTVSTVDTDRYFTFPGTVTITHEEHLPITIDPGTYKQVQEREYDWFTQAKREVVD